MKTLRRLRELRDPESFRLFGWSLLTIFAAAFLVRTRRLPSLLRYLSRPTHTDAGQKVRQEPDLRSLDRVRRYSHTIITRLLRSQHPCLLRSLVLYRYCRKHGVPAAIHYGVRSGADGLEGHSWVTLDGTPFGETEEGLRPYVAVYSYPTDESEAASQQAQFTAGCRP
ncbi:MAG: hypothetical protein C3F08_07460 [Candidatus Methylomirabilota bacterium]|nr:MAG: hypothetical protein C3F08_07460 [candidate division NC10 bacterium]